MGIILDTGFMDLESDNQWTYASFQECKYLL